MPLALNLSLNLAPGSYRWQVAIDGSVAAKASFTVIEAPGRPQQ
jgi:hypothetical protein